MPGKTGFDLLTELDRSPHVIFTTAYDEFALKAFKLNSVDYLLKPIKSEELSSALNKFKDVFSKKINKEIKVQKKIKLL